MGERLLLVDLENVQKINLAGVPTDVEVMIFHGALQKNLPVSLVTQTQPIGARLQWIRISGQGANALDFHIAFYLGVRLSSQPACECAILSRDTGFDPLVKHLTMLGHRCRRVEGLKAAFPSGFADDRDNFDTLLKRLKGDKARPKRRKGLEGRVRSWFPKVDEVSRIALIERLLAAGYVADGDGGLAYRLERTGEAVKI